MKGRTLWIAMVLAVLCLIAPGAAVLADNGQTSSGLFAELYKLLSVLIEQTTGAPPETFGGSPPSFPPNEPEAGILIPPGG